MQAGESLSFIATPEELAVIDAQSEVERDAVSVAFGELIHGLMMQNPNAFRSIERTEESGAVTVSEGSFSLTFADGSYLHLVAYRQSDGGGFLDLGLSVVEHSQEGVNLGGYLYELGDEGVRFAQHKGLIRSSATDGDDGDTADEEDYEHFSLIGYYEYADEAYLYLFDEDEEQRKLAEDSLRQLEEAASLGETERELGFGWGSPTLDDIEKLKGLASLVSPFKVETR